MFLKNILFIHAPRTAGTHLERLLGFKGHGERPACGNVEWGSDRSCIMGWDSELKIMLQHATYEEVIKNNLLPAASAYTNDFKRLSIIRNPYYRTISLFKYFGGENKWGSFDEFLEKLKDVLIERYFYKSLTNYLYYNNELQVDNLIRFESYKSDLDSFSQKHNLNLNISFDEEKQLKKRESIDSKYYNKSSTKEKVYNLYKDDFINFGYEI